MAHKALTVIGLPVCEEREVWKGIVAPVPTGETIRKEPGETITKQEFKDAGMTDEEIQAMEEAGSISSDMKAYLHPDHWQVAPDGKTTIDPSKAEEGAAADDNAA